MTDTKNMNIEFSSTGKMGIDTRSDNRFYWNVRQPIVNSQRVERSFNKLSQVKNVSERRKYQFDFNDVAKRRDVMRFIASDGAVQQLINPNNPFSENIEVAFPIGEGDWYVSLGRNGEERKTALPMEDLIHETATPDSLKYPPVVIDKVLNEGYTFKTDLSDILVKDQTFQLWEHTFGWTKEEVDSLAQNLADQKASGRKDVWFSALQKPDGRVVAVGMAERISFKRTDGSPLDVIELTEWSVEPGSRGNGYMPATVAQLVAQVLDSYSVETRNRDILLIAECNIGNFAHKTGYSAGLTVPERVASQILKQNVDVEGVKSDFAFMYVSPASLAKNYPPDVVKSIMRKTS